MLMAIGPCAIQDAARVKADPACLLQVTMMDWRSKRLTLSPSEWGHAALLLILILLSRGSGPLARRFDGRPGAASLVVPGRGHRTLAALLGV